MSTLLILPSTAQSEFDLPRLLGAALLLEPPICLCILGEAADLLAQAQCLPGIEAILYAPSALLDAPHLASLAQALLAECSKHQYIVAAHAPLQRELLARLSALSHLPLFTRIEAIGQDHALLRYAHAGRILQSWPATLPTLLTLHTIAFTAIEPSAQESVAALIPLALDQCRDPRIRSLRQQAQTSRGLEQAKVVIGIGAGANRTTVEQLLPPLAQTLQAQIGATRLAVEAGLLPATQQIGQTGQSIQAQIYLALGLSGAPQHLAGTLGCKTIWTINKDAEAPIFKVADHGLVGDIQELLPELTRRLGRKTA